MVSSRTTPTLEIAAEDGFATVTVTAPGIVFLQLSGRLEEGVGRKVAQALQSLTAGKGEFDSFWDLGSLDAYHSEVRQEITQYLLHHRNEIISIQAYVRSRIVQMGVSVANMALGGLVRAHSSREAFDAAYQQALENAKSPAAVR